MSAKRVGIVMLAAAAFVAAAAARADDASGRALFAKCAACHGDRGEGNQAVQAPALAGLPEWYVAQQLESFRAGRRGADPSDVYGVQMARMAEQLWDRTEVSSVASYVASLAPVTGGPTLRGGKAARGEALYSACAACHGPDATGDSELGAPPLRGREDWYLVNQLAAFRSGLRSVDADDSATAAHVPATLVGEQAVLDLAAHLAALKTPPESRARR
jgi:cytochrome c553